MFVLDRQRIDLLNRLIDARVDLAAYVQLRKAKGYMSVSESNHLRDNFFKPYPDLHDKSLRLISSSGSGRVECSSSC